MWLLCQSAFCREGTLWIVSSTAKRGELRESEICQYPEGQRLREYPFPISTHSPLELPHCPTFVSGKGADRTDLPPQLRCPAPSFLRPDVHSERIEMNYRSQSVRWGVFPILLRSNKWLRSFCQTHDGIRREHVICHLERVPTLVWPYPKRKIAPNELRYSRLNESSPFKASAPALPGH